MVFAGAASDTVRMLDTESLAWGTWAVTGAHIAAVNGILWAQDGAVVVSYDQADAGEDWDSVSETYVDFAQSIKTGMLSPAEPSARGWARVRGLSVHGPYNTVSYTLTVRIRGDAAQQDMLDATARTAVITPSALATTPRGPEPEFRCTIQRCSFATVELSATPGIAEWNAIDLWVAAGDGMAPARTRS
jgi:hypothetical protein